MLKTPSHQSQSTLPSSPPSSSPRLCICVPEPQHSPAKYETLNRIASFLRRDQLDPGAKDLVIPHFDHLALQALELDLRSRIILTGKEIDNLRYDYNPEETTLTIPCMLTPVHEAIVGFVGNAVAEMRECGFLSADERRCLQVQGSRDVALSTMRALPLERQKDSKSKGITAIKQPGTAISLTPRVAEEKWRAYPRVVFEVAFSQGAESGRADARQWLLRSEGAVLLVVLIKLNEAESWGEEPVTMEETVEERVQERKIGGREGISGACNRGNKDPVQDMSTDGDDEIHGNGSDDGISDNGNRASSSEPSVPSPTPQDYINWFSEDVRPYVGPISGFIELYRYNHTTNTVYQDGPCYNIYPNSIPDGVNRGPLLKITDLLPDQYIRGDMTRAFPLPLNIYREYIDDAVKQLAVNRRSLKAQATRKRRGEDKSNEYHPSAKPEHNFNEQGNRSKRNRIS